MHLQSLLSYLTFYKSQTLENPLITSIEMDSREVKQGSLFICINGYTLDGHEFVEQAISNGAIAIISELPLELSVPVVVVNDSKRAMAVLADAYYKHPSHKLTLIGVTGTNGKTSTTHMIDQIIIASGKKTGLIGTLHTKIGDQTFEVKNTTPESLTLQKTFFKMVQNEVDTAIMEVSSHALDLGRTHGCDFDIAVFTNLTQDHLDYHGTMAEYRRTKGLLFSQLGNTFDPNKEKFAVLNNDDEAADEYRRSSAAHIITYGIKKQSDIMASSIKMKHTGTSFILSIFEESYSVEINLVGMFSVYNVLAAVSTSLVAKVPIPIILETIVKLNGVQGRFELVHAGQDFAVVVDFAHTPDSLENALTTLKQFAKGKIFAIVGCGGDRDKTKRPIMARIATALADVPIFTSDNPRSEDPNQILKEMEAGVKAGSYQTIEDREEAIRYAIKQANKDDIVLIAGKGHETYQIIGQKVYNFDDREVAKKAILERLA
ncbi:UDP-N-acetylmuramoyl-L-alanyl-D-glutamate--2,6-diaminopimelate ligase [Bacillus sp. DJP31]|uniref:UDP-N-acetylmuramoyl-L-alanyl-D-glutamate--2, 6-diaminopimelate ligase n=1 Tax=Bacillus sp. DJP31 TaxID=3409789 RepID=UPI003BB64EDD